MLADRHSQRIVLAGASSLLGSEVKSLLEESKFAGWDLRLVDEDEAAGFITEAAGEATVIQKLDEDTFHSAHYAFLAGSQRFGKQCLPAARTSSATIIDLTRASLSEPDASLWFPKIEALSGKVVNKTAQLFSVFSVGATAVASLFWLVKDRYGVRRMFALFHEPVSEAGREGIEELETQTSQLLSFQSIGYPVFGTQAAFNLLPRFGNESRHRLDRKLLELRTEISAAIGDPEEDAKISVNLVHAPVFYGTTFSICVDLDKDIDAMALSGACRDAGFTMVDADEPAPSNIRVAGETTLFLSAPRAEHSRERTWWFWGAGDNLRVPAYNAIKLAEWVEG